MRRHTRMPLRRSQQEARHGAEWLHRDCLQSLQPQIQLLQTVSCKILIHSCDVKA